MSKQDKESKVSVSFSNWVSLDGPSVYTGICRRLSFRKNSVLADLNLNALLGLKMSLWPDFNHFAQIMTSLWFMSIATIGNTVTLPLGSIYRVSGLLSLVLFKWLRNNWRVPERCSQLSARLLILSEVTISESRDGAHFGFHAQSGVCLTFSLSLPLALPSMLSLALSQINKS